MKRKSDFRVATDGGPWATLYLLTPLTRAAQRWVERNLPEDRQTLGTSIAVEHRYIRPIVDGIRRDGLTVV